MRKILKYLAIGKVARKLLRRRRRS